MTLLINTPHPVRCQCGAWRGEIAGGGISNHAICYCTDCRAYARLLGRDDLLDAHGGTEVVQMSPARLRITAGADQLASVRLTEKGLLRWYAACCNTPIGNMPATSAVPIMGFIHAVLTPDRIDRDFGERRIIAFAASAIGATKLRDHGVIGGIARMLWIAGSGRVHGDHRHNPLFDQHGKPLVMPQIVDAAILSQLKSRDQSDILHRNP